MTFQPLGVAQKVISLRIIKLPQCLHLPHLTSEVKVREGPHFSRCHQEAMAAKANTIS